MVKIEDLLYRQGQLETEVLCLQDSIQRLAQRILILENFIRQKHGPLALEEIRVSSFPLSLSPNKDDDRAVGDFSDVFVQSPVITPGSPHFVVTSGGFKDRLDSDDVERSQENVPDAVREETVSVSGASINIVEVKYESDQISSEMNFMHGDVADFTEIVTYDVIPTSVVFDSGNTLGGECSEASAVVPTNKHAGTIRIYKPELKSFARVPTGADGGDSEPTDDGENHQCSVCHKIFLRKENLQRHIILHSVVRFQCDECDRTFNNIHNLNLHKGKHQRLRERKEKAENVRKRPDPGLNEEISNCATPSSPYKCRHCSLHFPTKSRRTGHERTHVDNKPYGCNVCGQSFRSKSGLADHAIGHKGQRNHLCHICPAGFLRSRNLLKHIRFVHSLVQIKTVVDGKRVVEFVSPDDAERLVEERKNNVERRKSSTTRSDTIPQRKLTRRVKSVRRLSNVAQIWRASEASGEDTRLPNSVSESEIIDEEMLDYIKNEPKQYEVTSNL